MTGPEHYAEGERLLKEAWNRDAGTGVGALLTAQAEAHFTAAIAYAKLEGLRQSERASALRRAMGPSV